VLLGAIETVGIVEELMEIWPHEVCDTKNRSTSKLIYYDQKQRSNKEPQGAMGTIPKIP